MTLFRRPKPEEIDLREELDLRDHREPTFAELEDLIGYAPDLRDRLADARRDSIAPSKETFR